MDLREHTALVIGKSLRVATHLLGSGGGALPGLVAHRLAPTLLTRLTNQCTEGITLVCGTNGKTTTSRMLAEIIGPASVVHNRSGSNLTRGHLAAFLEASSWTGRLRLKKAILEVDEAVFPETLRLTQPTLVLWHNLFRDQLDRYGEVDAIAQKWLKAVQNDFPQNCTLLVNADDPNLSYAASKAGIKNLAFYGLSDERQGTKKPIVSVDAYLSPASGQPLHYSSYYVSHLGVYNDPASNFSRPNPTSCATNIELTTTSSIFTIGEVQFTVPLPGLYNVYNALAATTLAQKLGVSLPRSQKVLATFQAAFGRNEKVKIGNHELVLCLIKNPVGAAEVLRTLAADPEPLNLLLFANDNFADGLDVSWYFDTPFEIVSHQITSITCLGIRKLDMAVRLKYAGVTAPIITNRSLESFITNQKKQSGKTYCLCTYTATLELQKYLTSHNYKAAFHAE